MNGCFEIKPQDEDIHTANERRLKVRRQKICLKMFIERKKDEGFPVTFHPLEVSC